MACQWILPLGTKYLPEQSLRPIGPSSAVSLWFQCFPHWTRQLDFTCHYPLPSYHKQRKEAGAKSQPLNLFWIVQARHLLVGWALRWFHQLLQPYSAVREMGRRNRILTDYRFLSHSLILSHCHKFFPVRLELLNGDVASKSAFMSLPILITAANPWIISSTP